MTLIERILLNLFLIMGIICQWVFLYIVGIIYLSLQDISEQISNTGSIWGGN